MLLRRFVLILALAAPALPAAAQTPTTEVDVTAGHSTDRVDAASSQARVFGDAPAGWTYYLEAAFAQSWGRDSDAFGAAYPYEGGFHPIEAFADRMFDRGPWMAGIRAGRFRTPFGISTRSDHAYNGFLRAPMIRHGQFWALSNTSLEAGATITAGVPRLFMEATVGAPQDIDDYARGSGVDRIFRVQGSAGPFVVGVSHSDTQPSEWFSFARGRARFSGVDVRWMAAGVLLRGEWISGRPFDQGHTSGGYADAIVHRPFMGPVTAVVRVDRVAYDAGPFSSYPHRYTAGARVRLASMLVAQANVIHQPVDPRLPSISALDVALTLTARK
jgi:hypothetical protein